MPRRDKSLFYANFGSQAAIENLADQYELDVLIKCVEPNYRRWVQRHCDNENFVILASKAMAHQSSGLVNVLMPDERDPNNRLYFLRKQGGPRKGRKTVWEEYEWPILKRNPEVTEIYRSSAFARLEITYVIHPPVSP